MTLVIPPGFANAAFVFGSTEGTPEFVTTMGVDLSEFGGAFVDCANTLMTYYSQTIGETTDSALTLVRVNLAVGSDGPGGSVDSSLPPIPCGRTGTMGPVAMSAIARKTTVELGRRGRGRMFLPGVLTQTEVTEGGAIGSTRLASLQIAVDDFFSALNEGEDPLFAAPPVLLHSSAPADPTPIVGLALAPLVGWIRGRIR